MQTAALASLGTGSCSSLRLWNFLLSSGTLKILILLKLGCVLPAGRGVSSDEDSYRLCLDGISSISTLVAMVTYFVGDLTLT